MNSYFRDALITVVHQNVPIQTHSRIQLLQTAILLSCTSSYHWMSIINIYIYSEQQNALTVYHGALYKHPVTLRILV